MAESFILALDQGTTSSRAIVFDRTGTPRAVARREFAQIYPRPGWVEHDPREIWASQSAVIAEVLARAGIAPSAIAALGITNQRETTLVWERATGRPIGNAIVWQDRRTAALCPRLEEAGHGELFARKTGLRLDPYFSGTKLAWMLEHHEGARARAERGELLFGTVDTWLLWNLTDGRVHATDPSNASRTLLYNIHENDWDDELLDCLGIPRAMLPRVGLSSEIYGETDAGRIGAAIPIAGMAGDQQAALFGQACFEPGMAKNTYGTGCFLLANTGTRAVRSAHGLLTTIAWRLPGEATTYALEGSVFIAGAVVQWLRDELRLVESAEACSALAASVPDAGGVFLVPAFTGLGTPYWDPHARGTIVGLTRGSGRAQICRAAIESIAFQSADVLEAMQRDSGLRLTELRVDGGAAQSAPLLQFQADLLQTDIVRPACLETTALGAAYLAGLAVGYWPSREAIARNWAVDARVKPSRAPEDVAASRRQWQRAVERARDWALEDA
ncbi:MAG: glycerol kinase [Verrucomicrobia bacterium]|nr:MAG: glycerol kinase [Verrucomicrobiota bacterium]